MGYLNLLDQLNLCIAIRINILWVLTMKGKKGC
jgi:hypothetical protein